MSPSKNTRSQVKRRGSPLFKLPAELRNMIYQLALIPDGGKFLVFDQTPPQDPPLLQTCKQIRSEAGSIYYGEARLRICAVDYDVSNFVRWLDLNPAREALSRKSRIGVRFTYDPTIRIWKNLMVWVDAYCQHRCPGFGDDEGDQSEEEKDENEQAEDDDDDEDEEQDEDEDKEEDDGADRPRHFDAPSTLDSVVEVFNMVHEWLLEDGMTMEELHLRLGSTARAS